MNTKLLATLAIGIIIGALVPACNRQPVAQAQRPEHPQQWEYKVFAVSSEGDNAAGLAKITKEYNALGAEGWEFAGSLGGAMNTFKRPKK